MPNLRQHLRQTGHLPVSDVATAIGCTEDTVRRWVRNGKVRHKRVGAGGRDTPSIYVELASVVAHLGAWAAPLLNMSPIQPGDPDVYVFDTDEEASAFIDGCNRFAPDGTTYRLVIDGGPVIQVKIIPKSEMK